MKRTALALALAAAFDASAVSLNPDGLGQALIFPYYTVRSSDGNAFNTYLSVVNHTSDAKAVRVRLREGRAAREVLRFNLYLSPNDIWTSAAVPTTTGARLITSDASCTDPAFTAGTGGVSSIDLRSDQYTGAFADGFGDTLDRTREGYVEMIEMATLLGASAAAITHNSAGVPANCAAIRVATTPTVAAPTGGLSGTLTLINVASGMDFTLNAEALADLASRPFFRAPADAYPDFAAAEIDPVSVVLANGQLYRSVWSRPVDAVSAVLLRYNWLSEYVLDSGTSSQTDFVVTQPVRHHYADASQFSLPYSSSASWSPSCGSTSGTQFGEPIADAFFNREERGASTTCQDFICPPPSPQRLCAAAGVTSVTNGAPHLPGLAGTTLVMGSETRGLHSAGRFRVTTGFQNGWIRMTPAPTGNSGTLTSLPQSTRVDLATGVMTGGAHVHSGLPIVAFAVRTFRNGTLACAGGACQGNYGGAFPFKYTRRITPP